MAKRKPWRTFKQKRQNHKHIRRICLALLAAEILILKARGPLRIPGVELSADKSQVVIYRLLGEEGSGDSEIPSKERVYGIRIRLKDGAVDFYRREELHDRRQ